MLLNAWQWPPRGIQTCKVICTSHAGLGPPLHPRNWCQCELPGCRDLFDAFRSVLGGGGMSHPRAPLVGAAELVTPALSPWCCRLQSALDTPGGSQAARAVACPSGRPQGAFRHGAPFDTQANLSWLAVVYAPGNADLAALFEESDRLLLEAHPELPALEWPLPSYMTGEPQNLESVTFELGRVDPLGPWVGP